MGILSFIPVTIFISNWDFISVFLLGLSVGIPDGILSFLGWTASQKGLQLELKIQREYEILKAKFLSKMKIRAEKRRERIENSRKR